MKHLVKLLCVLISACMLLPLVALSEGADLSERVDLVFFVMGDAPADEEMVETAVNEILLEKFNATLDFQFSTWTDFQQKYANQLISGGVDMIYIANWINFGVNATAGAFLELDELIDNYGANLKALIGEDALNMCRVGGELYAIPNAWPEYVPLGITYREDLRAKYDLPVPNSIENMEAYFLGVKEKEPEQPILRVTAEESQGLTIAFDIAQILNIKYPWVAPSGLDYGLAANYETPTDVYDYWFSDDFIEDCKLFKRWADLGFWSKSALSDTNDSESYRNGLCIAQGAGMNPNKQITAMKNFEEAAMGGPSEYITYGEVSGVMYPGHATQNGTAILRSAKNPQRAMMVLEYIMTDETMNRLVQAGIEGVHYNITADGLYVDVVLPSRFPYEGFNTWQLRNSEFKLIQKTDIELERMFAKYNELGAKTKFPNVNIHGGFSEDYTDYQAERASVRNVMSQYLAPLQAGLVDDVDAAVTEFRDKVKAAGLDVCREGYTQQWLDYCEEYDYK